MASHSSILAWRIPRTEEPGRLKSMLSQRAGHNWATEHMCTHTFSSVQLLSRVRLFVTPSTVARQAPLSMEFSRQEYWSGLPFPSPGDIPNSGIERVFLACSALAGRFFTTMPPGKPPKMCGLTQFSEREPYNSRRSTGFWQVGVEGSGLHDNPVSGPKSSPGILTPFVLPFRLMS